MPSTPLAGSSTGAIAVAAYGSGVSGQTIIEGTIRINQKCQDKGGARGNLLPLLFKELDDQLPDNAHEVINEREGMVGLAYKEIFPLRRDVLQTEFESRQDLIEAVCNSSMFPFFSTNFPCLMRMPKRKKWKVENKSASKDSSLLSTFPRLVVDGYFTVSRDRFGCPIFPTESQIDRTITVSTFPHDLIGLTASKQCDRISPCLISSLNANENTKQISTLVERATQASTEEVCWEMYDAGFSDANRWIDAENRRNLN